MENRFFYGALKKNKVKSKIKKVKGRFEKLKNAKSTDKMRLSRVIYPPKTSKEGLVVVEKLSRGG